MCISYLSKLKKDCRKIFNNKNENDVQNKSTTNLMTHFFGKKSAGFEKNQSHINISQ